MTGLGEDVYEPYPGAFDNILGKEKNDAVAEMVEEACIAYTELAIPKHSFKKERGLERDVSIARMRTALESLGIPLTVLAALKSGEWVSVPVRPKVSMLAHAVLIDDVPSKDDERLAAMAIDSHPNVASRGLRSDVIQVTAQIAADYRAMIASAPKEP